MENRLFYHTPAAAFEEALPLEDYIKKSEADYLATDAEVEQTVKQNKSINYSELNLRPEE